MVFGQFERWAVEQLLRNPTFNRGVRAIHGAFHSVKEGRAIEDLSKLMPSERTGPSLPRLFIDELKDQAGIKSISASKPAQKDQIPQGPRPSFFRLFLDELKNQASNRR